MTIGKTRPIGSFLSKTSWESDSKTFVLDLRFLGRICRLVYLWSKLSEIPVKEKVCEFDLEKAYDEANPLGYVVFHRIADVVTNLRMK